VSTFNILTWNLLNLGYGDYSPGRNANNQSLINYIARVADACDANLIVFQEVINSASVQVAFSIREALEAQTNADWSYPPPIRSAPETPTKIATNECYLFFIKSARDLSTPSGQWDWGLAPEPFPSNTGRSTGVSQGRRAAYFTFPDDQNRQIFVTNYHAPSKSVGAVAGLSALASMVNSRIPAPHATIMCGDYNVNICTADGLNDYQTRLMNPTGAREATRDRTSLRTINTAVYLSPTEKQDSQNYLSSGYDNIFCTHNLITAGSGLVGDLIRLNTTVDLRGWANTFVTRDALGQIAFSNSQYVNIPIDIADKFQSYVLTRYGISDHLPVFLNVTT
jgi:hypothetical protein